MVTTRIPLRGTGEETGAYYQCARISDDEEALLYAGSRIGIKRNGLGVG
jgi:hypothetical protein